MSLTNHHPQGEKTENGSGKWSSFVSTTEKNIYKVLNGKRKMIIFIFISYF